MSSHRRVCRGRSGTPGWLRSWLTRVSVPRTFAPVEPPRPTSHDITWAATCRAPPVHALYSLSDGGVYLLPRPENLPEPLPAPRGHRRRRRGGPPLRWYGAKSPT